MDANFHFPDEGESQEIPSLTDRQTREQDAEQLRLDFVRSKKFPPEKIESTEES